jgi:hypothetical protein
MARNKNQSFAKRKKEQDRKEKAANKRRRRAQRGSSPGVAGDPDVEDIVVGPQDRDEASAAEVALAVENAMTPRNAGARKKRKPSFGARLFVGNLDAAAHEQELRALFASKGYDLTDAFIPKDRATGESRGFAFVELANARDAAKAIEEMDGMKLHDQPLRVNAADRN